MKACAIGLLLGVSVLLPPAPVAVASPTLPPDPEPLFSAPPSAPPTPPPSAPPSSGEAAYADHGEDDADNEYDEFRQYGELIPVLPLGAGLASIGLGLAFLGLRLRQR